MNWRYLKSSERVSLQQVAADWDDAARRCAFLLLPDVGYPLSVDTSCWATLESERSSLMGSPVTSQQGIRVQVDVLETRDYLYLESQDGPPRFPDRIEPEPERVDQSSFLLGYDVADATGTSGLANCGYDPDSEASVLRGLFGAALNHHHLFRKTEDALEFRNLSNLRVPDHAPFFVYRLRTCQAGIPGLAITTL